MRRSVADTDLHQRLRDYLIRDFFQIEHPVDSQNVTLMLNLENVESVADALLRLFQLPTTVSDVRDVEKRVLFAFSEYLSASVLETERRVNAAHTLALQLEPFLKKLFARRYSGTAEIPSFRKLLEDVAGYQDEFLYKPTGEDLVAKLRLQRTDEAILHDAYHFRNIEAHESKIFSPVQEQRYWRSVVAAFLLIAKRNIDLVPDVRNRVEGMARTRSGLGVCLANLRARFDDAKWSHEYYVELNIDQGSKLDDWVDAFLASEDNRLLVLAGRTGAGKSTFLERLATKLADQALDTLDSGISEGLLVPVCLEIKRYVPSKRGYLLKKLYSEFDPNKVLGVNARNIAAWPQTLSPISFVLCLDGLDEVRHTMYPAVVSEIEELITDFENVKVIVTSRPLAVPNHWCKSLVHILPLSREEVMAYFGHPGRLSLLSSGVQATLESKPELVEILQDPLMAEAACRYWHQFEPPASESRLDPIDEQEALLEGPLLDHLYECFFDHHVRRLFGKWMRDYQRSRLTNSLASLALRVDGDPSANFESITEIFKKFDSDVTERESLLELFLEVGVLKSHNHEFTFRNDTVKTYFAAVGLRSHTRRRQDLEQILLLIPEANAFWRRCVELLKQMAPLYDLRPIEGHLASLSEATLSS
jgi:energy-coupling factor transporter ATP-binding protein EcfA2